MNEVIAAYHNLHHPGRSGTKRIISTRFRWPKMSSDVEWFVKHCLPCQVKKHSRLPNLPISKYSTPENRFHTVHADCMGPMKPCRRYRYIFTIRDRYTKYVVIAPLERVTSECTLNAFVRYYVCRFGVPVNLITDNGSNFTGQVFDQTCSVMDINHKTVTPYNPGSNGFIEAPNRTIKASIRCVDPDDWVSILPLIELAWNNTAQHESTYTPMQMVYGTATRLPSDLFEPHTTVVV